MKVPLLTDKFVNPRQWTDPIWTLDFGDLSVKFNALPKMTAKVPY